MGRLNRKSETRSTLDHKDRQILRLLQVDATQSVARIAAKVDLSKTAAWNRIQRMIEERVIIRQAAVLDPERIGLAETFFIAIKTAQHNSEWFHTFLKIVRDSPEITEAHRLTGEIDYLLKIQVASTRDFDAFYKILVSRIDIFSVTSSLSMERLKDGSELPLG